MLAYTFLYAHFYNELEVTITCGQKIVLYWIQGLYIYWREIILMDFCKNEIQRYREFYETIIQKGNFVFS